MITVKKHLRKRKNGASVVRQHLKKKKRYNKGNAPGGNLPRNSVSDGADKFLKSHSPNTPGHVATKKKKKKHAPYGGGPGHLIPKSSFMPDKSFPGSKSKKKKSNVGRSYMLKSHKSKNIHLTISGRGQGKKGRTKNQKGEIKTRIRSLKAKK